MSGPEDQRLPVEVGGAGRFMLPRRTFVPAYLKAREEARLRDRVAGAIEALRACALCPRDCEMEGIVDMHMPVRPAEIDEAARHARRAGLWRLDRGGRPTPVLG